MPEVDRHDTSSIYRKLTLGELQKEVPQLNWREYLQVTLGDVELEDDEALVSYATPYLVQMGKILAETDRRVVHNYIIWRLVTVPAAAVIIRRLLTFESFLTGDVNYDSYDRWLSARARRVSEDSAGHSVGKASMVRAGGKIDDNWITLPLLPGQPL